MTSLSSLAAMDFSKLESQLSTIMDDSELFQALVNAPFDQKVEAAYMFLGIIVLLMVDKKAGTINRVTLSKTDLADSTLAVTTVPFEKIKIPLDDTRNIIAKAIRTGDPQEATDWQYLFRPALPPAAARINQASAGIAYSAVYPLKARGGGALIFSYFQYRHDIGEAQVQFMRRYKDLVDRMLDR